QLQLVVRKNEKRFGSLEQARDQKMTIGSLRGCEAARLLAKMAIPSKLYEDQDGFFKDLSLARDLDGVLIDLPVALYYGVSDLPKQTASDNFLKHARRHPGLEFAGSPFGKGYYAIAVRKDNEALAAQLDLALDKLLSGGKIKHILEKWDLWNV